MILELVFGVIIIALCFKIFKKPSGIPPGDWGLPVIGAVPLDGTPLRDYFEKYRKKYGKIYMNKIGSRLFLMISDYKLAREAFSKVELTGRPDFFSTKIFNNFLNIGLILSEGKIWQDNRRFALTQLRDLGMGKSSIIEKIDTEVESLIKVFDSNLDKPYEISFVINAAVLNVTWALIASRRFELEDPQIIRLLELLNNDVILLQGPAVILSFLPWLEKIMPTFIRNSWLKVDKVVESRAEFRTFLENEINIHKKNFDMNDCRDFIDHYLKAVHDTKGDDQSAFTDDPLNLIASMSDLFIAGSETTSSTIRYALLFLAMHPDVQKKVHQDIDRVLPRDTVPRMEDREKLVYLDATIHEVMRYSTVVPLGVNHCALQDTMLGGYKIPQGACVVVNQEHCHRSKDYWLKPDQFYPEHFIGEDGKLLSKKEGFIPFSIGRRVCLGENLARQELFLFVSAIMQRYSVHPPPGTKLEHVDDRNRIFLNPPHIFELVLKKRI